MLGYKTNRGYLITIGDKYYFARMVTNIRDRFGLRSSYELRAIYRDLKAHGFWARKDGSLVIRVVEWIDYIPSKGVRDV